MNLHEFQAKELLTRFGIMIPRGRLAASGAEAASVARRLNVREFVVKAQIQAGERAAGGGIRFATSPDEVGTIAAEIIGRRLMTNQTGPAGEEVRWVYIEEAVPVVRSFYCAAVVDRSRGQLILVTRDRDDERSAGCGDGSVLPLEIVGSTARGDFDRAASPFGFEPVQRSLFAKRLSQIAEAAVSLDAILVEISPLALTPSGNFVALDAKVTIDDHALFRHPDIAALQDVNEGEDNDSVMLAADRHQINYLKLDGDIGVVVNGAGLALATLDLLHQAGGRAANFMDIRTTATSLDIAYAFGLIATNPQVRSVLVNVHGGGMQRCDTIADGIGIAFRRFGCSVPIVVRLAGNNAEFAATRLKSYGVSVVETADMWQAVNTAVQLATLKAA